MKFRITQIFNMLIWLFSVVRRILAAEKLSIPGAEKHQYVKAYIMPVIRKRELGFSSDDVDRIINGLIWFLNRLVRRGRG